MSLFTIKFFFLWSPNSTYTAAAAVSVCVRRSSAPSLPLVNPDSVQSGHNPGDKFDLILPQDCSPDLGDNPLKFQVVCPLNGTAVPKGLKVVPLQCYLLIIWIGGTCIAVALILEFESRRRVQAVFFFAKSGWRKKRSQPLKAPTRIDT